MQPKVLLIHWMRWWEPIDANEKHWDDHLRPSKTCSTFPLWMHSSLQTWIHYGNMYSKKILSSPFSHWSRKISCASTLKFGNVYHAEVVHMMRQVIFASVHHVKITINSFYGFNRFNSITDTWFTRFTRFNTHTNNKNVCQYSLNATAHTARCDKCKNRLFVTSPYCLFKVLWGLKDYLMHEHNFFSKMKYWSKLLS